MATGTIKANLMGGDSVTTKENLIFKIYGATDSYASAIHTTGAALVDADVSIVGDVVTITNVDVGVESDFKITSVDQALNESDKSIAYSIALADLSTELGTDLLIWLKDSTDVANLTQDGTKASAWLDASGNDDHGVQATSGMQPLLDADGLLFDGTDDAITVTPTATLTAFEFFMVIKIVSSIANKRVVAFDGTNKVMLQQATGAVVKFYSYINSASVNGDDYGIGNLAVLRCVVDNASSSIDGNALDIGGVGSMTAFTIGALSTGANASNITVKEVVVTKLLDSGKRTTVINRLNSLV